MRRLGMIAVLVLVAGCSSGSGAEEEGSEPPPARWAHAGYDLANTRAAAEEGIGTDDVAELRPAWQIDGLLGVTGTPVVVDGTVYVGDWTGHLRAIDAESGDEQWATDLETYYVAGAVAVDDELVVAGTYDADVVALRRDTGAPVWTTAVHDHPNAVVFGSPILVDGLVIVGVASLENVIPAERFTFRGAVVALDVDSGEEVWRYWTTAGDASEGAGVGGWSSPAVDEANGQVFVGTGQHYAPPASGRSDAVIALDLRTGEELWVHQFTPGDVWTLTGGSGADDDIGAAPNLFRAGATDAVGVGSKGGIYKALDRATGDELWSAKVAEPAGFGVMASAAVADDTVFVAANRHDGGADLVALDDGTGEERWRVEAASSLLGPVTWANGVVYLADNTGRLAGYAASDGELLWSHPVAALSASGIAVVDGSVYAGWGYWVTGPPPDPLGGLAAFRLDASPDPTDAAEPATASGEELFQRHCAACHGSTGEGANAPSLVGVVDRLGIAGARQVVSEGRGQMPAWEGTLSDEELAALVDYLATVGG